MQTLEVLRPFVREFLGPRARTRSGSIRLWADIVPLAWVSGRSRKAFRKEAGASDDSPDFPTYCCNPGAAMCLLCTSPLRGPERVRWQWIRECLKLGRGTKISGIIISAVTPGLKTRVERDQQTPPSCRFEHLLPRRQETDRAGF